MTAPAAARPGLAERARERLLDLLDQPILVKELRAALRRRRFVVLFTAALAVIGLLLVGGLTLGAGLAEAQDPSRLGRAAFLAFLCAEAVVVFLVFPAATCTSIIDEQASGTLDLLVTTRLRPGQVVLGKLLAGVVYGLLLVVSTLPLVAITFLYGGVAPWQIALSYAALVISGVVVASYGLLVSSLSQTTARAVVRTFLALPFVATLVLFPVAVVVGDLVVAPLEQPTRTTSLLGGLSTSALALGGLAVLAWPLAWSSLFLLLATDRLRPELDDRDGPRRRWTLATVGTALAIFAAWRLLTPWTGSLDATVAFQALLIAAIVVALATVALVAVAPLRPGEAPATGWRALLRPGLDGGADLVLLLALALAVTLLAIHSGPGTQGLRGGSLTRLTTIRDAGVAWLLAGSLCLVQAHRLLAASLRRFIRSALGPRLVTVGALLLLMGLSGPWLVMASRDGRDSAWPAAVLSPFAVGASIATEPSPHSRSGVLGPSSRVLDRLLEREDRARLAEHPPPRAEQQQPGLAPAHSTWRLARREERSRELLEDDLPLHVASTGLLLAVGLLISGWRWALSRRARSAPA